MRFALAGLWLLFTVYLISLNASAQYEAAVMSTQNGYPLPESIAIMQHCGSPVLRRAANQHLAEQQSLGSRLSSYDLGLIPSRQRHIR